MKKIILIMLISGIATCGFSQFLKKSSIIGGGTFQIETSKYKDFDSKGVSISIAPWAGYTIVNNLVLGASFEYSYSSSKNSSSSITYKGSSVFLAPFIRYYLNQGLFFQSQYGFGPTKSKYDFNGVITEDNGNSSILRWGVGYAARISDTVLFEPTMGYYAAGSSGNSSRSGLYVMGGFTIILKTVQ